MTSSPWSASIALAALLLSAYAFPGTGASSEPADIAGLTLTPSERIYILGNEDFTAENGVVSGSGSSDDPYIIEGWEITLTNTGTAVTVSTTDSYFVIRDIAITGAKIGIRFDTVYHGRITSVAIGNCSLGLSASYSEVCRFEDSVISNCSVGVSLMYCDAFKLDDIAYVENEQDLKVVELPWIQTRQADMMLLVIAVVLSAFVVMLLYLRHKSMKPPEERP